MSQSASVKIHESRVKSQLFLLQVFDIIGVSHFLLLGVGTSSVIIYFAGVLIIDEDCMKICLYILFYLTINFTCIFNWHIGNT